MVGGSLGRWIVNGRESRTCPPGEGRHEAGPEVRRQSEGEGPHEVRFSRIEAPEVGPEVRS